MDATKWADRLKRKLGSPPLKLHTPDETIDELIQEAIEKITPYLREAEYLEVQGPTVDLTNYRPLAILHVWPTTGLIPASAYGHLDEFTLVNYAAFSGLRESTMQIVMRNLYRSEIKSIIPEDFCLVDGILYLSGFTGPATVEMITPKSLEKMPDSYQNWVFDYSLSQLKQVEGEIRSKVKIEGSPIEMNGEALKQEGKNEETALLAQLGKEISAFIITR